MWYAQKTELTTIPTTTITTPKGCEKSLRMNSSVLGQTRHRHNLPSVIVPAVIGHCVAQLGQIRAGEFASNSTRLVASHIGQRKVTFIFCRVGGASRKPM